MTGQDSAKSTEDSKNPDKQIVNSLFQQAFTHKTGNLISMDLSIRGDPYWLGETNAAGPMEPRNATRRGQPAIVFSLRSPELPDEFREIDATRQTLANGIYNLTKITHSFSDGLFTQVLTGILEPFIDTEVTGLTTK